MTNQQHPITPPPELIRQWLLDAQMGEFYGELSDSQCYVGTQAARWGADQELGACCADLRMVLGPAQADWLRSVRRPKPPSLAEEAYGALDTYIYGNPDHNDKERTYNTIRRALERLQELENND